MMRSRLMIFSVATFLTASCGEVYRSIQKTNFDQQVVCDIKTMAGCCGCKAFYYNIYQNKILIEQFVVEIECKSCEPTMHIFNRNNKGKLTGINSYVAVTDDNYTIPLNEWDKRAFKIMDSIYSTWNSPTKREITFGAIKGFKEGAFTHFTIGIKK